MQKELFRIRFRHNVELAARSHGWPQLQPFRMENRGVSWVGKFAESGVRKVSLRWQPKGQTITVFSEGKKLGDSDCSFLREGVRWMFRG